MSEVFDPNEWITADEAAIITPYTAANIRKALRRGIIDGVKRAGVWFVLRGEVIKYVEQMQSLGDKKHDPRLRGNWPTAE